MATLTVWRFDDPAGAEDAAETLRALAKEELITVHDAATVSWPGNAKKPKTRQMHNLAGAGALGGAFWGTLFGLIFLMPLLGLALGAATGAVAGSMGDVGIDDDFIKRVRDEVTPGTSALFALTSNAVVDKVHEAFEHSTGELLFTNLSSEQENALREVFAD
ncbi:DUF1269 domain-containing protein [Lentzea tibetensis]|uniref:DUF1269 domain-containing protein n=1 Tax=Lentzea tibetensis TaxID=2591470 RepID=A0A563EJK3_9PSEU|nr:DUF1269 domain-containing protein [Lentzea tibetensis]TWP47030.1 DUF1269 domain-containing protein [Lentzea tibetensis]